MLPEQLQVKLVRQGLAPAMVPMLLLIVQLQNWQRG
jgi:hypothetical protein